MVDGVHMSITKLFLSVSVIAMFAVGSAWATDPENTRDDASDTVATSHRDDIYPSGLGPITAADGITAALSQFKGSGIAGVTYVNRMVGVAGGAAQQAEDHAAAAGAYAIDAAESADEAKSALEGKVDIEQGEENKQKVMTTDVNGNVVAGAVGQSLTVSEDGTLSAPTDIEPTEGSANLITSGAVWDKLDGKVDSDNGQTNMFMVTDNEGYVTAGSVGPGLQVANDEARVIIDDASALDFDGNNALTVAEASATVPGVMKWGQIPSGSETSTTSATIWIE